MVNKTSWALLGAAALLAGLSQTAAAADNAKADKAIADKGLAADVIVNGQIISENHIRLMAAGFEKEKSGQALSGADARAAARTELITEEVLAQEARRSGLDKTPAVADLLAFQNREILARAYLEDYFAKNPVTEASLRSAYEWNRANGKIQEYKIRQILLPTADEAASVIAQLGKGGDFIELAKRNTRDPGGQNNGGDLGWFRPDVFVDHHFSDAVVALKKGEYNKTPLRTRFGWHVIKLEEGPRPVSKPESYDELSDNAREALRQKTAQQQIENLTARLTAKARLAGPGAGGAQNDKAAK
ncbi:peptidyl-prolyl cis-trans isomerase C [Solimonas aquatica]|uniref:peptidylprolyl isomerase n=1 Tax=Solimonas aquatica TaxID=489703 RepID=A0A1H9FPG6_9GAMM|nr:peptidyl-prolyl cis-trans isomerase C [Solimonas aquatica]